MTPQRLSDLFKTIAQEIKGYQLLLNFGTDETLLQKVAGILLKSAPTTAFKISNDSSIAHDFLLSDHWVSIVINGKDRNPLDLPTLVQKKHIMAPFLVL